MKSVWNKVRDWSSIGDRLIWLQYGALSLIILLPVLLPGYILALDMVFTPHIAWPTDITSTFPLDILLWLLGQVLPGDVVQKLVLLAILMLSGVGMHLFIKELSPKKATFGWQVAAYFAGVFYMINPFIYARLMAGQWLVLLGYALLPFVLWAMMRLLARPTWRRTAAVALWTWAVVTASIHLIGVVMVVGVLFLVAATVRYWTRRTTLMRFALQLCAAGFVALVLMSYWLIPALFSQNIISELALRAGDAEFAAFATHSGPLGTVGEVLRLQGFWVETRQMFALPQGIMPLWGVLMLLLWVLVALGAVRAWKTNKTIAVVALGSIAAGVALAASPLMQWLSQAFPLLGGYREPHKFTVLVVVGYGVLGAFGVLRLIENRRHAKLWASVCLALPLLITPTMLWAGAGQLQPRDYPTQWYALNSRLNESINEGEKVLFLPWHMYAPYSFSERIIANPADEFFDVPVIISDDPEFAGVAPNSADATKQQITNLIKDPQNVTDVLAELKIRYVVLAKEQDWQSYSFLKELTTVHEDEKLILYEVKQ